MQLGPWQLKPLEPGLDPGGPLRSRVQGDARARRSGRLWAAISDRA